VWRRPPSPTSSKSAKPAQLVEAVARTAAGDPVFTVGLAGLVLGEYRVELTRYAIEQGFDENS
jgi:hypothetical protein